MNEKANNVNEFWAAYMDAVVGSGVQEDIAEWYVRWAQRFAISIKGKPLRARSSEDVRRVLRDLKCQEGIEPWQTKQARADSQKSG
jgi:hypothetical protein